MEVNKPTAIITGITGQDGAYLSRLLLHKGYRVHGIIRDSAHPDLRNLAILGIQDQVKLHPANLMDLTNLAVLLERIAPHEIYHLAAQSSVGRSFAQPIDTIEFNTMSTLNLLEAMRLCGLPARFYQASSSEMFGRAPRLPVNEETAMHPVSPYGISKAASHWIAVNYRESHGMFCACGILFNHESCLRAPHFVTKKIISTAVAISRGQAQTLKLGNLEVARDWGYAPEYVRAMWLMLQQHRPDDYIIATNQAHTLRQFVEAVFQYLGLECRRYLREDPALYRPSELDIIYGDPAKARRELGWHYQMSFHDLIARLVEDEIKLGSVGAGENQPAQETGEK